MESEELLRLLPVVPWTLAAVATVLMVALGVPPGGPRELDLRAGPSPVARLPFAVLAGGLLVAAVLGARLGPDDGVRNPVPALVVGLGWPLLLLLPVLLGPAVRRLIPRPAPADQDVRPAIVAALGVVSFLVIPLDPTRPAVVATALGAYALVVVAVGIALGRRAAAARVEVLGLLARWGALGPGLVRWAAPRGALAILAVVLGGAWFERYERTAAWRDAIPGRSETVLGLVLALALAAAGAWVLDRVTARAGAAVLLPLVYATAVAGVARRALISAQVVAGTRPLDPDPVGVVGGQVLALVLVGLGGALSCAVLARRAGEGAARLPGVGVLLLLTTVSAAVVLQP